MMPADYCKTVIRYMEGAQQDMRSRLFRVPARQLHMLPYARPALRLRRARPLPCLPAQPRRTFGPPGRAFAARSFWRDSRLFRAAVGFS